MVEKKKIRKWHPVYTQSRAEKKAYKALLGKDIEVYLPLHRQLKQWSDRKKWIEEPLLKSYLFVHIEPGQETEVLMTSGISRFLYFSGKIATMPDQQIVDLKLLLSSPHELEITEENLASGEKIEIKAGPLKGLRGEIIKYKSRKQLLLRLGDIQRCIIVNVSASLIDRIA